MDDLKEAINDEIAKSEYYYELAKRNFSDEVLDRLYKALGEKYKQYATWLKELKAYREAHEAIENMKPSWVHTDGVKLCLCILKERLEKDG